jgi:hypothetical protein
LSAPALIDLDKFESGLGHSQRTDGLICGAAKRAIGSPAKKSRFNEVAQHLIASRWVEAPQPASLREGKG